MLLRLRWFHTCTGQHTVFEMVPTPAAHARRLAAVLPSCCLLQMPRLRPNLPSLISVH